MNEFVISYEFEKLVFTAYLAPIEGKKFRRTCIATQLFFFEVEKRLVLRVGMAFKDIVKFK